MTNNEKIKEAERLIAEANKLIAEVKNNKDDAIILTDYIYAFTKLDRMYYIDSDGSIDYVFHSLPFDDMDPSPYGYYPTIELAEQAKAMKDFNDKMLAFKYCYDADYVPDWTDLSLSKYTVYWDALDGAYGVDWGRTMYRENSVYFSTEEIAQKCADWLNSLKED